MKDATDITIILDRSGSMDAIRTDVIGGYNTFLEEQKKEPDPATLSLIQFDHEYTPVYVNAPIQNAPPLSTKTFVPRGNTALCDAVGRTIVAAGERFSALPEEERPKRVIMVIITDGMENGSKEWTRKQVNMLITQQTEKYGWQFVYLAANQDAFAAGQELGISQTMDYAATPAGTSEVLRSAGVGVANFRKGKGYSTNEPEKK